MVVSVVSQKSHLGDVSIKPLGAGTMGGSRDIIPYNVQLTPNTEAPMDGYVIISIIKCGWNNMSISKLQLCSPWCLRMDK